MERLPVDPAGAARPVSAESRLEELGLPVRARNALRAAGCQSIADILRLDLAVPIRGLGRKAKEELFEKLAEAGYSHPADEQRASEITMLERSLKKIEERMDSALSLVTKELRSARLRLQRLKSGE